MLAESPPHADLLSAPGCRSCEARSAALGELRRSCRSQPRSAECTGPAHPPWYRKECHEAVCCHIRRIYAAGSGADNGGVVHCSRRSTGRLPGCRSGGRKGGLTRRQAWQRWQRRAACWEGGAFQPSVLAATAWAAHHMSCSYAVAAISAEVNTLKS